MSLGNKILDIIKERATLWKERPSYWYTREDEDTVCFAAKREDSQGHTIEIAELNLKDNVLYINSDYKGKYKKAINDIKKDFGVNKVFEYTYMK